ncbi:hypothetical protein MUCCIDRAFT_183364 [Mucor lusitanicus CBS 277.49]|uniref:Uncharacterized protein n=1 Tax=Mucor lusitanicus CBS 277.49 TaxID=747725 RepID=A0A168M1R5_MUCCL|nr:hypothetical protein MUCCIDRAFT_183364 [Mucor lusitanicus CBS 277.49]
MSKSKAKGVATSSKTKGKSVASSNTILRKPTPEKRVREFKLTEEQCGSLEVDNLFSNLATIQWSDVDQLIDESINCYGDTLGSTEVHNNIVTSLQSMHQQMKNNAALASYCLKCSRYLKQGHIRTLFDKKFASKLVKFQTVELKKLNKAQGQRNATLITSQCNDNYYDELLSGSKSHEISDENEDTEDQETSEMSDSEDDQFPSDLTLDHHPQRTADYFLIHDDSSENMFEQNYDDDWIIGEDNISGRCRSVKETTLALISNPAKLSDIRLLALNDIYLFDEKLHESVSKYFGTEVHRQVIADIDRSAHRPLPPLKSYTWCQQVVDDPPTDLLSSLKVCTVFLQEATNQINEVDLHVAHTMTYLLPVLVAGADDAAQEDSANATLNQDMQYKPDFQVSTRFINVKCVIIVAEFKPKSHHSSTESDLIKLGKQLKLMYNDLVAKGTPHPTVGGLLCQGENACTFIMDLPSPQVYRMTKLSQITLCRKVTESSLLPVLVSKLIQIKNVALENLKKAEDSILRASNTMTRPPSNPPSSWLSSSSCQLSRLNRKRKANEDAD